MNTESTPHLLACTDGSLYAPSVYAHSAWAAACLGIGIKVLQVHEPGHGLAEDQALLNRLKSKAILGDAVQQLAAAGVAQVETVQRQGTLASAIAELERAAELVVVGKCGEHCAFHEGHLGGELLRIILSSMRPVLIASRAFRPIQRFLVAHDSGPSMVKAIHYLTHSPLLAGMECHILRTGEVDDNALYQMEQAARLLRGTGYSVTTHAISGAVEEVTATLVKEQRIDLLVRGTYGQSSIRQFLLGSDSATLRTCQIPALIFR